MRELATDLLILISIGQFLDHVFVGPKERNLICTYLGKDFSTTGLLGRYLSFLDLASNMIFNRFFSTSFSSPRFILSAATVSVTSFSFIVLGQSLLFSDGLSFLTLNKHQLAIIALFLLFNIFADYLTIVQTKAFVDAATSAKTFFRSSLFLASDIIVTLNLFILLFAAFVFVFSQAYLAPSLQAEISFLQLTPQPQKSGENDGQSGAQSGDASSSSTDDGQVVGWERLPVYGLVKAGKDVSSFQLNYVGSRTLTANQILQVFSSLTTTQIKVENVESFRSDELVSSLKANMSSIQSAFFDQTVASNDVEGYKITASLSGATTSFQRLDSDYTAAFSTVDKLEDAFPAILFQSVGWERLDTFLYDLNRNTYLLNGTSARLCLGEKHVQSVEIVTSFDNLDERSCQDFALIDTNTLSQLQGVVGSTGRVPSELYLPYNPMFITSVAPTVFFYVTICMFSISFFCLLKFLPAFKAQKRYWFERRFRFH